MSTNNDGESTDGNMSHPQMTQLLHVLWVVSRLSFIPFPFLFSFMVSTLVLVVGQVAPMLPALPVYNSPDCHAGGEMHHSPSIGYGSLNCVLCGQGESARGASFVPSPGPGIDIVMVDDVDMVVKVEAEQ